MYNFESLRQCGKRVKSKIQKVLGANSYVCISHKGSLVVEERGKQKALFPLPALS